MNGFTIYESHDSILIRINLYLGVKDSMKLIDDKDVVEQRKSRFHTSLSSISFIESLTPRYKLILINKEVMMLMLSLDWSILMLFRKLWC